MNANDIKPAVIMAMAAPSKGCGMSAAAKRSRIAENKINTSEKPAPAQKPYSDDCMKLRSLLAFCSATPSTAQLVVIRGALIRAH